jgi:flagellar hook-associated protein 2
VAGAVTFGGIGSGIDVEGLISGLVGIERSRLAPTQQKITETRAAVTALGDLSGLLSKLRSAASALDAPTKAASFSAKSSSAAVVATANGSALPSSYDIEVLQLASEQRSYTDGFASKVNALGQQGTLQVQIGSQDPVEIQIEETDSLQSIVNKLNATGARISASTFSDGSSFRIQVRGLDSGAANAVSFVETGVSFGLSTPANTVQQARDASVKIDGFTVTSATNKIDGAIQGVSLALTEKTTAPISLRVEADADGAKSKVADFVSAFNAVIDRVQTLSGFGSRKPQNAVLAADSSLRGVVGRLTSTVTAALESEGGLRRLADLGITLQRDGKLALSESKFKEMFAKDPRAVSELLGGAGTGSGVMDNVRAVLLDITDPKTGMIPTRRNGLETRIRSLDDRVMREQLRIERYADTLRKQFTEMDQAVARNAALLRQIG